MTVVPDAVITDQTRAAIALLSGDGPSIEQLSVAEARAAVAARRALVTAAPRDVAVVETEMIAGPAGAVRLRRYDASPDRPAAGRGIAVYVHGGGWILGDLDSHDGIARELAAGSGLVVVSVEYRLAPEHPFPAALDDVLAVSRFVARSAEAARLGGDREAITLIGDSAGGNLAAAAAIALQGEIALHRLVLVYPVTDAACETASYDRNREGFFLTAATMRWFWAMYLGADADPDDPLVSPLRAPELAGFPPTYIVTAGNDPLCDEGEAFGARLRSAGVPVTHRRYADMVHGFFGLYAALPAARAALDEVCAVLADDGPPA